MVDFHRYVAPGVFTESIPGPVIGNLSSAPTSVGLVGDTARHRVQTETVVIPTSASSEPLSMSGIKDDSIVVMNPVTGEVYALTTDYTLDKSGGEVRIKRKSDGEIEADQEVSVSYNYVPEDFHDIKIFYDNDDVERAYGVPFDSSGGIRSPLSLAARMAFLNGASSVVCVAVDPASASPTTGEFEDALNKILGESSISVVVPVSGSEQVHAATKWHVLAASANGNERRGIVGFDGASGEVDSATRISRAQALKSSRIAAVSPSLVTLTNLGSDLAEDVGGQYLAAALAGIVTANSPSRPLTRRTLNGIAGLPERMSGSQKSAESERGLMVVERVNNGPFRVRHGVTTDPTSLQTREWSILGQSDTMSYRVRDLLDADGIIGETITDLTLANVKASVDVALQSLTDEGIILGYRNLKVRQDPQAPDVVEVRYEWRASVPLNYVVIRFSIDLTTGSVTDEDF